MRRWLTIGIGAAAVVVAIAAVAIVVRQSAEAQPTEALDPPTFVEVTATSGVDHAYDGDWTYFVGGGVAAFDCDADRYPDMVLAGGERPSSIYRNTSASEGDITFERVAAPEVEIDGVTGAYPVDIDGDGVLDLVLLRRGENVLLKGVGDCRFGRANELWSFDGGEVWTTAFSATWETPNQRPTLAFGNYLEIDEAGNPTGACVDNLLVRQDDGRRYFDQTVLTPGLCSLSVLFSDWSRQGTTDLRITNDKHYYRDGEEQLWRIDLDREPELYTRQDGWQKLQIWGMGIASHDVTGDGLPEVYLTSQGDNKLQTLADGPDQPEYTDIAIRRGVTAHRPYAGGDPMPSTAWHPEFQDVNNDGFSDLYVAKGNVDAMPEFAAMDPNNLLIGQPDGTFVEGAETAGLVTFAKTRGAALVDLDLDGLLDLIEVNRVEPVRIWQNVGSGTADAPRAMGNWIAVDLANGGANRNGVGAVIEVEVGDLVITRERVIGGGHAGDQLGWEHFGIGPAGSAEVRVRWPDGETGPWFRLEAGTRAIIGRTDATTVDVGTGRTP